MIFSTETLDALVQTTLKEVVQELEKLKVPAKIVNSPLGIRLDGYYLNIIDIDEDRHQPKDSGRRIKWVFRSLYMDTRTIAAKVLRGDSKDLVAKLVRSVKERHESILEAQKEDAKQIRAREEATAVLDKIRKCFPEFANNIQVRVSGGSWHLSVEFSKLNQETVMALLKALRALGIESV